MKIINQTKSGLALEERCPDFEGDIPDWQLMAMLHYEYARCSKLMLKAVKAIRKRHTLKTPRSNAGAFHPPFANYLARQFPEFPKTSWEKIESKVRLERLADLGIDEHNGLYSAPPPGWESWELFAPEAPANIEELLDIDAESCGIFKIDFGQENSVIERQFSTWLIDRRSFLLGKYDSTGKFAAGITQNTNDRFRGRSPRKRIRGGGAPPKKYRLALTALGNLRTFIHAQRVVARANKMSEQKDLSSWNKYETYGAGMMMCVQSVWKCRASIVDVFDGKSLKRNVGFGDFIYPPKSLDESRRGKVELVQKFLEQNFTIAQLRKV